MAVSWRSLLRYLVPGLVFALIVALAPPLLDVRMVVYATNGCPPNYCYPTKVTLPLLAIGLGSALALLIMPRDGLIAWVVRGASLGLGSALYVSAIAAVAVPFQDVYFTFPYRAYALAYVALLTLALACWSWYVIRARSGNGPTDRIAMVALFVVAGAILATLTRRELQVTGAVVGGLAGGLLVAELVVRRWLRLRAMRIEHAVYAFAVIAFLVRTFFGIQTLLRTGPGMLFAVASDDGDSYYMLASKLAADPRAISDVLAATAFPPGYSLFVGTILGLTRESLAMVIIAQALLAAAATVLLYALARPLAGRPAALLAAAIYALDQNLIQNQSTLTAEALLLPLTLLTLWSLVRYRARGQLRWLVVGSIALGSAFITRNLVAMPLIAAVAVWLFGWRRPQPRLLLRDATILVVAILAASAPIAVATAVRDGSPRLTTQLAALAWEFEGAEGMTIGNGALLARDIRPFTDPAGSLGRFLSDPVPVLAFYAAAVPQRISTLLFFPGSGYSDPLLIVNPSMRANPYGEIVGLVRLIGLLVGIVATAAWWWRRRDPDVTLIALSALLYLAAFSFIFPPYHPFRYRIPIEPIRFLTEAVGLVIVGRYVVGAWAAGTMLSPKATSQAASPMAAGQRG